jgi:hypothetical protein
LETPELLRKLFRINELQRSPILKTKWPAPGKLYQLKLEFSRNLSGRAEMKKSRYTEEQIIGILKQHEAGMKTVKTSLRQRCSG